MTITFVWSIGSVGVQCLFTEKLTVDQCSSSLKLGNITLNIAERPCPKIKNQPLQDNISTTKDGNSYFLVEVWCLVFLIMRVRANLSSLNSFGYPIIDKYFEIRECCYLCPESFRLCTNPVPTFDTNNPRTFGVCVSFLYSKTIITRSSFV